MRRSALWLLLCAAVVALWTVSPPPAAWLDRVYGGVVYPAIAAVLVPLTGALELPVAALVIAGLLLWLVLSLVFSKRTGRSAVWRGLWRTLVGTATLAALFVVLWGANYGRTPLETRLNLSAGTTPEPLETAALADALADILRENADAPEAWDTNTGSPATVVGVIDEGIDVNHPDLRENIWTNSGEVAGNRIDDDGNGYVDDVNGYDFANDDASVYDPDPISGKGDEHGTHVAGTIAAVGDNGIGVAGVNWDAQVASLKFLAADGGYTSDAIEAINYAVAEGMDISNNSWGGGGRSQALEDAIKRADSAGHIFIAAAGNGGQDGVGDNNDATPDYPASYGVPNVVSVAATDDTDALASFSNFGATTVDLAAPGVGILSTLPGNRYGRYSGTSMATPHVAGVAALIKSQEPGLDDAQIKAKLLRYTDEKASLQNKVATNGRLNALRSLTENSDTTKPRVTAPRPASGGSTRDRTPNVSATVTDAETDLQQDAIRFSLDGNRRDNFSYNTGTDRLTYTPPRLAFGRHTVGVVAEDEAGNVTTYNWGFKVVR